MTKKFPLKFFLSLKLFDIVGFRCRENILVLYSFKLPRNIKSKTFMVDPSWVNTDIEYNNSNNASKLFL